MASALMRRSAVTALLAAAATIASPLVSAFATAPSGPTFSPANGATVKATRPDISATYAVSIDASSSTLTLTDSTAGRAINCPVSYQDTSMSCTPTEDLIDNHSYTVNAHGQNPDGHNDASATWTVDVPSVTSTTPKDGDVVSNGTVKAIFDEAIDPSSYVRITDKDGNTTTGGSLSNQNGLPSPAPKDTITYNPPTLPPGTYEAQVHGVASGNAGSWSDTFINFTVNTTDPTQPPSVTTAGITIDSGATRWINAANAAAVPFAGAAQPNFRVGVLIYDPNVSLPVGCNHTAAKPCQDDRAASVGVAPCGQATCPWNIRVNTTNNNGTPDRPATGSTSYLYNVYSYGATGTQFSAGTFHMGKDTQAPSAPLGPSANTNGNLLTVTATATDATSWAYNVVVTDGFGNSKTQNLIPAANQGSSNPDPTQHNLVANNFSPSQPGADPFDVANLEDGNSNSSEAPALKAAVYAVDQADNVSSASLPSGSADKETRTLTPDFSRSFITTGDSEVTLDKLNGGAINTPTSITVVFNEPIRADAPTSGSNPPVYVTNLQVRSHTGFALQGHPTVNADKRSMTWTFDATPTAGGSPYRITELSAVAATCLDTGNDTSCEEWPADVNSGATPSGDIASFSIDNTAPNVNVTGVNGTGANNGMNADNLGSTVISGTVDPDATNVTLTIKPATGSTVAEPGPSGTITITPPASGQTLATWHTSALPLSIADGTATITASASDAAGNHSPIDPAAANPDGSSRSLSTLVHARPDAPQNLNVAAGNGNAVLTWSPPTYTGAPDKTITSYVLSYTDTSVAGSSAQPGPSISGTATTATVTGLANGHTYSFALAASNGSYTGASATRSATPKGNTALAMSLPRWIVYGHSVALRGFLTYAGVGVANEHISVTPVYYNGKHGPTVTATTDQFGNWSAGTVKPAKNVTYVASFAGDNAYNASSTHARVLVKARVRITKPTAKSSSHLSPVTFHGSVAPNMHGRWVYVYEKVGRKLHRLARVRLSKKSTWSWSHAFGKGTHYVFAKFLTQNGNQGNVSGTAKFRRT